MATETTLWNAYHKKFPGDVCRVENLVDSGYPDVSGTWDGIDYYVELKVCDLKNERHEVYHNPESLCRPAQLAWHARRQRERAIILVMVRYPASFKIFKCVGAGKYEEVLYFKKSSNFNEAIQCILIRLNKEQRQERK